MTHNAELTEDEDGDLLLSINHYSILDVLGGGGYFDFAPPLARHLGWYFISFVGSSRVTYPCHLSASAPITLLLCDGSIMTFF
jgi:hypothetical protein